MHASQFFNVEFTSSLPQLSVYYVYIYSAGEDYMYCPMPPYICCPRLYCPLYILFKTIYTVQCHQSKPRKTTTYHKPSVPINYSSKPILQVATP